MVNPRLQSAKILQKVLEEKVFFGDLKKNIPEKDLPFCNMLILTVLRRFTALKHILDGYLSKKIPHKHCLAEYLLLGAIAEILYMQTAEYAVINETVKNIRTACDKFLGGLANAVLRKVCAQKQELLQAAETISPFPKSFLSILEGYSADEIQQIAAVVSAIPALDISVKNNPPQWAEKFKAQVLPNGSLRLYNQPKIQLLPQYNDGAWWVQDVAASLPVAVMGDILGKEVIDLCAAPGGKTAQLAARGAKVTALDISATRLETLKQNMHRLGFDGVKTLAADALEYLRNPPQKFDVVLLDAPCSATGIFRRHPEVLHIKSLQDVKEQANLQKLLLESCGNALKIGGILVYCVCSISKEEGEKQIAGFLNNCPQFKIVPIEESVISAYGQWKNQLITPEGTVRTLPYYQDGMDSFFICKMQRII